MDKPSMVMERRKVRLNELRENPDNPRKISDKDMEYLVKSLEEFPEMLDLREIIVDEAMSVLGGNMRLRALRRLAVKECVVKVVKGLSDKQKKEFIVKDNAYYGDWDYDALLRDWGDLDLEGWGVDLPEFDDISIDVLESSGGLSGGNYGDRHSDGIPMNILGIGGIIDRGLMEQVKERLVAKGAVMGDDNGEFLTEIFTTWLV